MKETKEEQDEIWEEFLDEVLYCIGEFGGFDTNKFMENKNDYIILRKPKEEIKQ